MRWIWHRQCRRVVRYESGNSVKEILGTPNLVWETNRKQGAYEGQPIYDGERARPPRISGP